jgi:signal recognition particle subunit SEC65
LKRAEIRRQIPTRKSVQNNEADRIADLLEEAAAEISRLRFYEKEYIGRE